MMNTNGSSLVNRPIRLFPCSICKRTFNMSSLEKHEKICEKMSKKRTVFDSSLQRRTLEAEKFGETLKRSKMPNDGKASTSKPSTSPSTSKGKSAAGVCKPPMANSNPTMARRANAGGVTQSSEAARPPVRPASAAATMAAPSRAPVVEPILAPVVEPILAPVVEPIAAAPAAAAAPAPTAAPVNRRAAAPVNPRAAAPVNRRAAAPVNPRAPRAPLHTAHRALQLCPHCNRSFNERSYDKHVEWCSKSSKEVPFVRFCSNEADIAANAQAKQRMQTRIGYKPPTPKVKQTL